MFLGLSLLILLILLYSCAVSLAIWRVLSVDFPSIIIYSISVKVCSKTLLTVFLMYLSALKVTVITEIFLIILYEL